MTRAEALLVAPDRLLFHVLLRIKYRSPNGTMPGGGCLIATFHGWAMGRFAQ